MAHYEEKIENALASLRSPSKLNPTGQNPITYIVYQPEDVFILRGLVNNYLRQKAEYLGFKPVFISMGEMVEKFIENHPFKSLWTTPGFKEADVFNSIRQAMEQEEYFEKEFLRLQEEHASVPETLFIVKDVEMLHPIYMMGKIESNIYNKVKLPILVLYPGVSQGTARSFLGIYNQDGSYRSTNY